MESLKFLNTLDHKTAAGILLAKVLFLSPLTSFFRIKDKRFISAEDTRAGGRVGDTDTIRRIRNAQRNDIENVFTAVWVLFLTSKNYDSTFLAVLVGCRIFHGVFYILALQPFRGLCWVVSYFQIHYMIYNLYNEAQDGGNHFNVVASLLLFYVHASNLVTGLSRKMSKTPQNREDGRAAVEQNETTERLLIHSHRNVYYSVALLVVAVLTKNHEILPVTDVTNLVYFFLYCRLANTAGIILGLPNMFKMACFGGSAFFFMKLACPWDLCKDFVGSFEKAETLLVVLVVKHVLVACLEQVCNLLNGGFDLSRQQVVHPEKHLEDENVRMVNIQRNDAEVGLVFATMLMVIGIDQVPFDFVYYFVISRCCHTLAYVLHIPQPARALSWFVGVYFTVKVIMMAF